LSAFELWHHVFGASYLDCLTLAAAFGVLLGVYIWAFDIDPFASKP
jgi:hypothetical protein